MDLASLQAEIKLGMPPLITGWTNEDFVKLLQMYEANCAPSTLAVHFKKTRGQIAGVLWRAQQKGLIEPKRKFLKPRVAKPKPDPAVTLNKIMTAQLIRKLIVKKVRKTRRVRLRLVDASNEVTFAELEPHHCRWPIGDPRNSDFRFCGCRRVLTKPYCEAHIIKAGRMYEGKAPPVRPSYRR